MLSKRLFLFSLVTTSLFSTLSAQEKPKWDVGKPTGMPYSNVSFDVDEGTWLNLDLSPDGNTIVFDMLGDIYSIPASGGTARCLRSGLPWEVQPRFSPDGRKILFTSDAGGGDNIWVMNADGTAAKQVTKESFRLLNNGAWMPDGQYIVARKHFTSGRSLGAGELWMYHLSGGEGVQITKRKNDQQDVNEPSVSSDGRYIYFSEDMYPGGFFQYNKNPNQQIFAVRRYDTQKGEIEDITGGSGGACRPQISSDGKWLAFVRRNYQKTVLCVHNLESGLEFPIYDGLDKDQQEAWTIFGCYPGFAWTPDNRAIFIWAKGKIKRIDLDLNASEPKMTKVADIPFNATVNTPVAETLNSRQTAFEEQFTVRALRHAVTSPNGETLVFSANGSLYSKKMPDGKPTLLTASVRAEGETYPRDNHNEFEPSWSPDGQSIVFVSWNDENLGALWLLNFRTNSLRRISAEKGIFRTPSFSPDAKSIVYRKQGGDDELGFAYGKKPGIYVLNLNAKTPEFVSESGENPRFNADGKRIVVQTGGYLFGALDKSLKSYNLSGQEEQVHFKSKYVNQWAPSPDGKWLAFSELHKVYVCAMPPVGRTIDLSADSKAFPLTQLSRDAGINLHWSADSKLVHWTLGEEYFSSELNKRFAFLEGAPDSLPVLDSTGIIIGLSLPADVPVGVVLLNNARIITMENDLVIENGVVEVTGNKITFVGTKKDHQRRSKPSGPVSTIDCSGKTIMPGIVDVHAHSGNFRYGLNPQKQWEYYANLAYGVTTSHDPSANSEMSFSNAELIKSGKMRGPRLFSTGTIIYGAEGDFKAVINNLDDARSHLRRTKAWGAFSVKSYNQPRRDQRQQVIAAARELNMLVMPEGGSFFYHNLTQVVDGHTGIEHNIPVAPLYKDVTTLWSKTKSHNTPTLIVNYGGVNGEYYWYQNIDVWKQERLLNFTPRHIVDERSRHVTKVPDEEYQNGHILVSQSCKKLQDVGVNINLGAHGQMQGIGAHWELWMLHQGGMSNLQALRCATINGAQYIGMGDQLGSIKEGKLADLVVLDKNPLDNIRNSETVRYTMANGRLFDAMTLDELGNHPAKRSKFWFEQPGGETSGSMDGHTCHEANCVCGH